MRGKSWVSPRTSGPADSKLRPTWDLGVHGVGSGEASSIGEIMQSFLKFSVGTVFLMASVLATGRAYGQGGATGAISGSVRDSNGGEVADAEVQIINTATDSVTRK